MTQEKWDAVDDYMNQWLIPPDESLDSVLKECDAAGLDPIAVAPNQGKFLHLLAKLQKAHHILEIGTLGGYSAIWMAKALPASGGVVTLELNPKNAEVARTNIEKAGLSGSIQIKVGPALTSLNLLVQEKAGPFDLIFIDADKPSYPEYLTWSLKLSRVGTLIVLDNMVRKGEVVTAAEGDERVVGARRTYEMIAKEPRLSATGIQTVGAKGHDGFVMALVIA